MAIARVYIEKINGSGDFVHVETIEVVRYFNIYCKSIPFKIYGEVKEPYSNDWLDEDGVEEYYPAKGFRMKPYELEVEWAYKGAINSANTKIKNFLDFLSGRSDSTPEMNIYCTWTGIGRKNVRLVKVSDKATIVRDEDNGDIVIFSTTLKVCDPVTDFKPKIIEQEVGV